MMKNGAGIWLYCNFKIKTYVMLVSQGKPPGTRCDSSKLKYGRYYPLNYNIKVIIMENQALEKRKLPAELCSCVDDEKSSLHLEFTIPGVRKEDIDLKLNPDSFSLKADKNDVEFSLARVELKRLGVKL